MDGTLDGVKTLRDLGARMLYSLDQGEVPDSLKRRASKRIADVVAQPRTIDEVKLVLRHAQETKSPIVPRGVASSAYGGALPFDGGIVLDASWMREILGFEGESVAVQAGVRWSDIERAAEPRGLALRSYPTNCFSTVAGWVSTGGYGIGSTRYGHLSESVESLRVMLANGEERTLTPADPEFGLWFGSDGQLGLIAEVKLKLRPLPATRIPKLVTFDSVEAAIVGLRSVFEKGGSPYFGNLWTAARMREKNHLMKRNDFEEKPTLVLMVESREDAALVDACGGRVQDAWKAQLCWEDRFFPIRAKKLGPGILAAEMLFDLKDVPAYFARAEELGRKFRFEVVAECQIVGRDRGVAIVTFLFDNRNEKAHFRASAFAMKLAVTALRGGAEPYNLGVWYSAFAERKYGPRYKEIKSYKSKVDPAGIFNPGKSLSRPFGLTVLSKTFAFFNWLPFWFKNPVPPIGEPPAKYDSRNGLDTCTKCAACVAYCPAVLTVGDERVSARGKLFLAEWTRQGLLAPEEAQIVNLCMHCKFCTEVCQSDIVLEDAFFDLEKAANEKHGRPDAKIKEFLEQVERSKIMERLPMCRPDPAWVTENLEYDEDSGQISYRG
ncbi:MAG TPA: FAD-binding protein [Planctomycetota bacterium]|nr:FAD-binding protein [Planctomycetota bacterium]